MERVANFIMFLGAKLYVNLKMMPQFESVYRFHLGEELPGFKEILRNASLIFTNTHVSVNHLRPSFVNVVEIGGVHCREGTKLPMVCTFFNF